jgi:hypothetical protein
MGGRPEPYSIPKHEEQQSKADHNHSCHESQHTGLKRSDHVRQAAEYLAYRDTEQ